MGLQTAVWRIISSIALPEEPMADLHSTCLARFLACLLLAAACAIATPPALGQSAGLTPLRDLIAQHERALADARRSKSVKDEGTELNELGVLYRQTGQPQKALDCLNEELQLWRRVNSHNGEALALDAIGRVYADLGQDEKALDFYNQALPLWRDSHNRRGEGITLSNQCHTYDDKGELQRALDLCNQALPVWAETNSHAGGEALNFTNIAHVYSDLGQKQRAIEFGNKAVEAWHTIGEFGGEALALNRLGKVYSELGQQQKALDLFNRALPIWRARGDRNGEAEDLIYIGRAYSAQSENQKALDAYTLALPIWRATGDRRGEAATLNYSGMAYAYLGQRDKALAAYIQALPIWREVGKRDGEAATLANIGFAYDAIGQKEKALPNEMAAMAIAKEIGDPDLTGKIDSLLMRYFREDHNADTAILFGTDAVNSFQRIRKNISGLDQDLQAGFAQSKSGTYRLLAELLVQQDRLSEAEQVLDLLKEEELKEVVRGAGDHVPAQAIKPLELTSAQQQAQTALAGQEKTAIALTALSTEYGALLAKASRAPAEEARLKTLDAQIEAGNSEVSSFFKKTLYPQLAQKAGSQDANALLSREKSEVSRLQNTLADLGPRVLGIRLLLGEDHAYALVVTAHTREKVELKATPEELRAKVALVRDGLHSPSTNPKARLTELYAMVVAPLEPQLKALEAQPATSQHRAPTLLWSLDGVLRYVPMAALYDGTHYMAERFNNVLFTPESYGHMGPVAGMGGPLRVLAMGLSKSYGGLPALPGVMPELEAVVHDPAVPASHGPMDGKLLPDDQFTLAAMKTELGNGNNFSVIHIASHFVVEAGAGEEPYLMLGGDTTGASDGYALTLSKMEDSAITFHGTQLLTLSACSTAKGDAATDGLEMDSLGMIAQQKDAGAVLATLWDVDDTSTSRMISDFYSRWVKLPADGKAEALRQAQLALLHGAGAGAAYAHPFYWASFVLIGNFQ
jgi:CHAT domain-containing protein